MKLRADSPGARHVRGDHGPVRPRTFSSRHGAFWAGAGWIATWGTFTAAGPFDGWRNGKVPLSGKVRGTGRLERPPLSLRRVRFDTALSGAISAPALPGWVLAAEQGDVLYEGRPLPLGPVAIRGSARPAENSYLVDGVEIRSGSLGRLTGQAAYRGGNVSARLTGRDFPRKSSSCRDLWRILLEGVVSHARRFHPRGWTPWKAAAAWRPRHVVDIGFVPPRHTCFRSWPGRSTSSRISRRPRTHASLRCSGGSSLGTVYPTSRRIRWSFARGYPGGAGVLGAPSRRRSIDSADHDQGRRVVRAKVAPPGRSQWRRPTRTIFRTFREPLGVVAPVCRLGRWKAPPRRPFRRRHREPPTWPDRSAARRDLHRGEEPPVCPGRRRSPDLLLLGAKPWLPAPPMR